MFLIHYDDFLLVLDSLGCSSLAALPTVILENMANILQQSRKMLWWLDFSQALKSKDIYRI